MVLFVSKNYVCVAECSKKILIITFVGNHKLQANSSSNKKGFFSTAGANLLMPI